MQRKTIGALSTLASFATAFAEQRGEDDEASTDFVIPEDLSELSDTDLANLHEQAIANFDALRGDGSDLTEEDMTSLGELTDGIEALATEVTARNDAAAERRAQADALASRVHGETDDDASDEAEDAGDGEAAADEAEASDDDAGDEQAEATDADNTADADASASTEASGDEQAEAGRQPQQVAASSAPRRREVRVNLGARRGGALPRRAARNPRTIRDVLVASSDTAGFAQGAGLTWDGVGQVVDRRLTGFNSSAYARAANEKRALRQQHAVAAIRRDFPEELTLSSNAPEAVEEVVGRAVSEARLPGGSLVASGGWCAPSQTIYDLLETESNDGLLDLPEIGVTRGGISFTRGPNFADLYENPGFFYTEQEDIDGDYDGAGGGTKPCIRVDCPEFEEVRLQLDGICFTAGLLQMRGYPEMIGRTTRGGLVAHRHALSARQITGMVNDSTAVRMPAGQQGASASVLNAIELQVEHYRYSQRLARGTNLEAIFPYWALSVVRADLAHRDGLDVLAVTDQQITNWFSARGVRAQFVYDWQPLTGDAGAFVTWPDTVQFLLYAAGTWVRGVSDVINIDTLYDSTLLAENDYTALFFEEGWLVAKRGYDSRVVEVDTCANGAVGARVSLDCDGVAGGGGAGEA